jgi:ribosomal protein S18 acetylase RimI-like enzyme
MDSDRVTLRPVTEDDLPVLDRFLMEPEASGSFEWYGWWDPGRVRRRWDENGLLGADAGYLMVVRGTDRLGFVAWRKVVTSRSSFCWNMGIGLLPEARGHGYGTEAQRQLAGRSAAHGWRARLACGWVLGPAPIGLVTCWFGCFRRAWSGVSVVRRLGPQRGG